MAPAPCPRTAHPRVPVTPVRFPCALARQAPRAMRARHADGLRIPAARGRDRYVEKGKTTPCVHAHRLRANRGRLQGPPHAGVSREVHFPPLRCAAQGA